MQIKTFDYENICEMQEVAKTIRQQIGLKNLMAIGAREWRFLGWHAQGKQGLSMRVGAGSKRQFIEILLEDNDTYTVISYKLKRVTDIRIELERATDVYCEILGEIVYRMVNK